MTSPTWHGGAQAVVTLTFDVDAETPILAAGRRYADHLMTMSHQAYGPDVGVPRILEMLAELGVPATFFVPGWVAEQRPGLAATIVEHGHEVAHHSYSHRAPTSLSADEERADFERALAVFVAQGIEIHHSTSGRLVEHEELESITQSLSHSAAKIRKCFVSQRLSRDLTEIEKQQERSVLTASKSLKSCCVRRSKRRINVID